MSKYLYYVEIAGGMNNKNFQQFRENVLSLGAKPIDRFVGIVRACTLSHHMDAETIHLLCIANFEGIKSASDVTVTEVTRENLESNFRGLREIVSSYYLPYGDFPNLSEV